MKKNIDLSEFAKSFDETIKALEKFTECLRKFGEQVFLLDKDIASIWPVGGPPDPGKQK